MLGRGLCVVVLRAPRSANTFKQTEKTFWLVWKHRRSRWLRRACCKIQWLMKRVIKQRNHQTNRKLTSIFLLSPGNISVVIGLFSVSLCLRLFKCCTSAVTGEHFFSSCLLLTRHRSIKRQRSLKLLFGLFKYHYWILLMEKNTFRLNRLTYFRQIC